MKKVLFVLLLILGTVAGTVVYLLYNLDSIVAGIIEESGTQALGTPVQVNAVHIDLKSGQATVQELTVANPPGFSAHPAIRFGLITVEIEIPSLTIKRVYAREPEVRVETSGSKNNFIVLQENISTNSQAEGGGSTGGPATVNIELVEIEKARAMITSDLRPEPVVREVAKITFRHLNGTPTQVAGQIAVQIIGKVVAATAADALEAQVRKKLGEEGKAGGLRDALEKLFQ